MLLSKNLTSLSQKTNVFVVLFRISLGVDITFITFVFLSFIFWQCVKPHRHSWHVVGSLSQSRTMVECTSPVDFPQVYNLRITPIVLYKSTPGLVQLHQLIDWSCVKCPLAWLITRHNKSPLGCIIIRQTKLLHGTTF